MNFLIEVDACLAGSAGPIGSTAGPNPIVESLVAEIDWPRVTREFLATLHPRSKTALPWVCGYGHEWEESLYNRSRGTGCPYCSGKRVAFENSIASDEGLAKEFASTNPLSSENVSKVSRRFFEWVCEDGHGFSATPFNRSVRGLSCPVCGGKRTLTGFNDLLITNPSLATEYDPSNVLPVSQVRGNEGRVVRWVCGGCGHRWSRSLRLRAVRGQGCPNCYRRTQSRAEQQFFETLQELLQEVFQEEVSVVRNDRSVLGGKELDFLVPELGLAIEFNGDFWHGDSMLSKRGLTAVGHHGEKLALANAAGLCLLFVWESDWRDSRTLVETLLKEFLKEFLKNFPKGFLKSSETGSGMGSGTGDGLSGSVLCENPSGGQRWPEVPELFRKLENGS